MDIRRMKSLKMMVIIFLALGLLSCTNVLNPKSEGKKISSSYDLPKDHIIVTKTATEIFEAAENGQSFVLYLGFPECIWCQALTPTLNEVAIEKGISEIWYWNPKEFRGNPADGVEHHEDYLEMLDLIGLDRPASNEKGINGVSRVSVPFIALINDGTVDTFNTDPTILGNGELIRNALGKETIVIEEARYQDGWMVNKNGDFITAFMWDDLVTGYQLPDGYKNKMEWLTTEDFNIARRKALLKLLKASKCGTCS